MAMIITNSCGAFRMCVMYNNFFINICNSIISYAYSYGYDYNKFLWSISYVCDLQQFFYKHKP